jgi:addiction module HigA family antidote
VPEQFLTGLINGHRSITPSLAMRLGVICRTTREYWLDLQKTYDMQTGKNRGDRQRRTKGTQTDYRAAAA